MGDIEVHCPCDPHDFRISINLEATIQLPTIPNQHDISHSRKKDRLSYSKSPFQIDLTQVTNIGV